jgi:transposase
MRAYWRRWARCLSLCPTPRSRRKPCFSWTWPASQRASPCDRRPDRGLIDDRPRTAHRSQGPTSALLARPAKARLAPVLRQIEELDAEIAACLEAQARTACKHEILRSIPGLGRIAEAVLLVFLPVVFLPVVFLPVVFLPVVGMLERRQLGSLAGLVPYNSASGRTKGKARIGGGRKPFRHALSMPALVASRYNSDLKAKYDALCAAGTPKKFALVAIMQNLLELANALISDNRQWSPRYP